jgi:glycosyltransferase involved in cell wall biosynthesis
MLTAFLSISCLLNPLLPSGYEQRVLQSRRNGSSLFQPGPPDSRLRQSWGFGPEVFLIGHVAALVPIKNHAYLLRSLARVKSQVGLLFAGAELDPAYSTGLRELAASLGVSQRVRFCGKVGDIPYFWG